MNGRSRFCWRAKSKQRKEAKENMKRFFGAIPGLRIRRRVCAALALRDLTARCGAREIPDLLRDLSSKGDHERALARRVQCARESMGSANHVMTDAAIARYAGGPTTPSFVAWYAANGLDEGVIHEVLARAEDRRK